MNPHNKRIEFGKHKGELWTRLPVSYLNWIANNKDFVGREEHELATAELKRRGTAFPTIEISGHAIDRASLRCRKLWHEDRGEDEGLHAWLVRVSEEAIAANAASKSDAIFYKGMKLVFERGEFFPTLITVMVANI